MTTPSPLLSPTKARQNARLAKDWAFVTHWLTSKFSPQPIPRFERNTETLNALLALANVNEVADGEVMLMQAAEREEVGRFETELGTGTQLREEMLRELEGRMDSEGRGTVEELAEAGVLLGTRKSELVEMRERIFELQKQKLDTETLLKKAEDTHALLLSRVDKMKLELEDHSQKGIEAERHEENILQETAQLNRETKHFTAKADEYTERAEGLEKFTISCPTIGEVKQQETHVKSLQVSVKMLEKELAKYQGLPPDLAAARGEYQRAKVELQNLEKQREQMFDRMLNR